MLMMHTPLVALAELVQFIAVMIALSMYCHRNVLKQYVSKTVD